MVATFKLWGLSVSYPASLKTPSRLRVPMAVHGSGSLLAGVLVEDIIGGRIFLCEFGKAHSRFQHRSPIEQGCFIGGNVKRFFQFYLNIVPLLDSLYLEFFC